MFICYSKKQKNLYLLELHAAVMKYVKIMWGFASKPTGGGRSGQGCRRDQTGHEHIIILLCICHKIIIDSGWKFF